MKDGNASVILLDFLFVLLALLYILLLWRGCGKSIGTMDAVPYTMRIAQ